MEAYYASSEIFHARHAKAAIAYLANEQAGTVKRAAVVAGLVEGNSIRATSRMTGVSKPTILKLLADLGTVCAEYHDRVVRDIVCKRIQVPSCTFLQAERKSNLTTTPFALCP